MRVSTTRFLHTGVLLFLAVGTLSAGTTYYVDDDGGPGIDFADIQAAIDGSTPGDTLIVNPGQYAPFAVSSARRILGAGRDLVQVGPGGGGVPGIKIHEVPFGSEVVVSGMSASSKGGLGVEFIDGVPVFVLVGFGIHCLDNTGQVVLHDVAVTGHDVLDTADMLGLRIVDSELVLVSSLQVGPIVEAGHTTEAMRVENSGVWIWDSQIEGGFAFQYFIDSWTQSHPGIVATDSSVYVARSRVLGGKGGTFSQGGFPIFVPDSPGIRAESSIVKVVDGPGAELSCPALEATQASVVVASSFVAIPTCTGGVFPHEEFEIDATSTLDLLDVEYPTLVASALALSPGDAGSLTLEGPDGAAAILLGSLSTSAALLIPGVDGAIALNPLSLVLVVPGVLTGGAMQLPFAVPDEPGLVGLVLFTQAGIVDGAAQRLSNLAVLAVLP